MEPLLTSHWGQNEPYNNSCPTIPGIASIRTVTGCVATGMAQVL